MSKLFLQVHLHKLKTLIYILQCTSDDDIAKFRHIFCEWIIDKRMAPNNYHFKVIEHIPFTRRYIQMVYAEEHWSSPPSDELCTALRPETEFDRIELALWLKKLLTHIHKEMNVSLINLESLFYY